MTNKRKYLRLALTNAGYTSIRSAIDVRIQRIDSIGDVYYKDRTNSNFKAEVTYNSSRVNSFTITSLDCNCLETQYNIISWEASTIDSHGPLDVIIINVADDISGFLDSNGGFNIKDCEQNIIISGISVISYVYENGETQITFADNIYDLGDNSCFGSMSCEDYDYQGFSNLTISGITTLQIVTGGFGIGSNVEFYNKTSYSPARLIITSEVYDNVDLGNGYSLLTFNEEIRVISEDFCINDIGIPANVKFIVVDVESNPIVGAIISITGYLLGRGDQQNITDDNGEITINRPFPNSGSILTVNTEYDYDISADGFTTYRGTLTTNSDTSVLEINCVMEV